jgi:hypothetical protein
MLCNCQCNFLKMKLKNSLSKQETDTICVGFN